MTDSPKPTVVLLYGDDRLALEEQVADLVQRLGDPAAVAGSVERFSGPRLDLAALQRHLMAIPFLAPRRMALVELPALPSRKSDFEDRLPALLDAIPPTSVLVGLRSVDYTELDRLVRRMRQQPSPEGYAGVHAEASAVYRWILDHPEKGVAREHRTPHGAGFERWLAQRARHLGGEIEAPAAELLREACAEDTLVANQELRKLIAYAGPGDPITRTAVERLTPLHAEGDVFTMVESLGEGDGRMALRHLRTLLEAEDARYLFGMVVRQFRLLILARHALDRGSSPESLLRQTPHRLPGFIAERVARQALRFPAPTLAAIYADLFELDIASKSGGADLAVGLETLVASLAN